MKSPTVSKQYEALITGLGSTTQSALTRPLISALWTSHTLAKQKYKKRYEQTLDASQTNHKTVRINGIALLETSGDQKIMSSSDLAM